jgi:hypothetical protein
MGKITKKKDFKVFYYGGLGEWNELHMKHLDRNMA